MPPTLYTRLFIFIFHRVKTPVARHSQYSAALPHPFFPLHPTGMGRSRYDIQLRIKDVWKRAKQEAVGFANNNDDVEKASSAC